MPLALRDKSVYVVGSNRLQNSLMASFLNQATGAKCRALESPAQVPRKDDGDGNNKRLVLWDCLGKDVEGCMLSFDMEGYDLFGSSRSALFNVCQGLGIEEKALSCGAEGIFYEQQLAEDLARGIRVIFAGELWISRKILADYLRKNNGQYQNRNRKRKKHVNLTRREREVLTLVASGAKNAEIAATLYISHHTVRTHLFNVYKKIDVPNRFQAILWATENL